MVRIGLCGTQSVGKSTIVEALKMEEQFKDYKFFTERSKILNSNGVPLNKQSTKEGQMTFMLERASELIEGNMLTDRTFIDVFAFTNLSEHIQNEDKEMLKEYTKKMIKGYDILIYIPIKFDLVDNGVRSTDNDFRKKVDEQILKLLIESGVNFHIMTTEGVENRVKEFKNYFGYFMKSKMDEIKEELMRKLSE